MRRQRGSAVGDYLLLIAAIAGVLIPLVMKYFGEPILRTFNSQRGRLVEFVAQTPVRPGGRTLQNSWFGQEKQGEYNPNEMPDTPELPDPPDLDEPPELEGGKDLKGGRTMRRGRNLKQGRQLKQGARLQTNELSGGSQLGGGDGGGGFGSGGSANDADFFDKGGTVGGPPTGGGEGVNAGKRASSPTSNFESGESSGGGGGGSAKKKDDDKGGGASSEAASIAQGKSKQDLDVGTAEEEARKRSKAFDWWTIIKVLIILLILFLLALIALSNLKKR